MTWLILLAVVVAGMLMLLQCKRQTIRWQNRQNQNNVTEVYNAFTGR